MKNLCRFGIAVVSAAALFASSSCDNSTGPTAPGRLKILASTTGDNRDVGYLVFVDSAPARLLLSSDTVGVEGLFTGEHRVRVAGVAPNCTLAGSAIRTVTISSNKTLTDTVTVTCTATSPRVLWGSDADGNYDLYSANEDGSDFVRITTDTAYHGQWSPDGTRILFMSPKSGAHQLYVADADGTHETQLTSDAGDHDFPQWSPDGSRIAYCVAFQLWIMNADGSNQHLAGASGVDGAVSWSPDGKKIAYGTNADIFVLDVAQASTTQLTHTAHYGATTPVWSPDGRSIAYVANPDLSGFNIFVMNADGTGPVNLTNTDFSVANEQVAWSPDGALLAFRSNRQSGHPDIYLMGTDGTALHKISFDTGDNYGPAWHP